MSERTEVPAQPVELAPRMVRRHPLTRTQSQIWSSQRWNAEAPIANMGKRHRIRGSIDPVRFTRAVDEVVRASDGLRTTVYTAPGVEPEVRIVADPPAETQVIELGPEQMDAWCSDRIAVPIDATECVYDSVLIRHAADDWTWWFDLHHVATDARSSALVFDAVSDAYVALGEPTSPRRPDAALDALDLHLAEVVDADDPGRGRERRAGWAELVASIEAAGPIAPYGPRGTRTTAVARRPVALPGRLSDALSGPYRTVSRELGLLGLLASAMAVVLHRLDGRSTVTLGIPVHHRSSRRARRVVGPLMEIYPLAVTIEPDDDLSGLFARIQKDLVGLLRRAKPGESPDFDVDAIVNVVTASYGDFAGLPTHTEWMRSGHVDPAHSIRVQAYDYGGDLRVELDLNDGLSADGSHAAMPAHVALVLERAVDDHGAGVGSFDILTDDDREIVDRLNRPAPIRADGRPIHERVLDVLRAAPDRVVVEHGDDVLTAAELDRRSEELSAELVAMGVRRGDRVGIRMRRCPDVVVAVHGVLRAGAAFVMLDPDHPEARHDVIRRDAGLVTVVDELPASPSVRRGEPPSVGLDDLAYVLYTSGSTGEPKGVPISHRGLADYLDFALQTYVDDEPPVMPLHSALVFDLTITSLFLPQLAGGRTIVVSEDGVAGLSRIANDRRLTMLKATPSQLELIGRMATEPLPLRTVIVGGEAFRRPVAETFVAACRSGVRIFNEYGPTEAVVGCMIHEWIPDRDGGPDVPIGVASPGAEIFVLDPLRRRTPTGAWGELFVRRPGMAAGYLGRPELSEERFAPVAGLGARPLYRTGDRVRIQRDGFVVFGGRLDEQLDVGGVRLEPGEVEAALVTHPAIANAVVRVWTPADRVARLVHCVRCGLATDVPGVRIDDRGVCSVCGEFDRVRPQATSWFRSEEDLAAELARARAVRTGSFDCLHLLSGGKDSTYALYQLVERGWNVHAFTLDNGFISDGAKDNIRRTVQDLGISHEMVTTDAMNDIFRDSLERYSNVCNGCYKTIYTLAVARAHELGIPTIVTGLSRGQFFETRLIPHQFESGRFDPRAIDDTVLEARRVYHRTPDAVTALLPEQVVFERDDLDVLAEIEFVDFYRYVDVSLSEMYSFLEGRAPWVRPADTGRSTNCLINAAGIFVHRTEQGFHNYAEPYSWDVRLGHKTRDEALEELDDELDLAEVRRILTTVGYEPTVPTILTAWYQTSEVDSIVAPDELRDHLRRLLPAHAVPAAFVRIDEVPLAASAKLDVAALPAPHRRTRDGAELVLPSTPTEVALGELWRSLLGVDRIGVDDDFFDLGGASLAALEMVALIEDRFAVELDDAAVFHHRTIAALAPLVEQAAAEPAVGTRVSTQAVPIPRRDDAPLSAGQRSLLFDVLADPDSPRYGVTRRYRFGDRADSTPRADRVEEALRRVVARHDTLRWTFSEPRRMLSVDRALEWRIERVASSTEAVATAQRQAQRPFDVLDGPRLRATWVVAPDGPHLVMSLHHLWCDAGSFDVLWRDLAAAMRGTELPPIAVSYAEHAAWQADRVDDAELAWFRDVLASADNSPDLALPAPPQPEPDGYERRAVELPTRPTGSLFAPFVAAVDVVLTAYADVNPVVGIPMTTRDVPDVADLVGYFLNTVALPLPGVGGTFGDVVVRTESLLASAIRHRTVPYASVVRDRAARGENTDLARVMVVHDPPATASLEGYPATGETLFNGAAVTDLSFLVTETESGCEIAAEWSGRRFARDAVGELLDQVERVLVRGLTEPAIDTATLIARTSPMRGPDASVDETTVIDRIWDEVPGARVAVRAGDHTIDYGELRRRADVVAAALVARGLLPNDRVGILVDRSIDQVIAVLGVLRAGATYVPIDPRYPRRRIEELLAGGSPRMVIADSADPPAAVGDVDVATLDEMMADESDSSLGSVPRPSGDSGAYIIFTSGTTGIPRGVLVDHRRLAFSTEVRDIVYPDAPTRFLWTSSAGFDSSIVGLFWTLTTGGELVLPEPDRATDVDHLIDEIAARSITHLLTVPSLWAGVLARARGSGRSAALRSLTDVIVAGEVVRASVVDAHDHVVSDCRLWNEYGPTEATVWSTVHRCRRGEDPVPIGRPIPGTSVRIVTDDGRDVPLGAAGELWIGGPNVTAGYVDDPDGTSERFVSDRDGRWYRSGDRVVADETGLVFLGRVDDQLSVNGVRLEPGEVERVLASVPGVSAAAVAVSSSGRREELVALVEVFDVTEEGLVPTLRAEVEARLPAAIVPARYLTFEELPRSPHGKIDRAAVTTLAKREQVVSDAPAPTITEATGPVLPILVEVWRNVLGRPDLDVRSDFFDAGGDSLAAVELVLAVEERLGVELSITGLINGRTPEAVAEILGVKDEGRPTLVDAERLVVLEAGDDTEPTIVHVPAWDDVFGYVPLADAVVDACRRDGRALPRQVALHHRPEARHDVARASATDEALRTVGALAETFAADLERADIRGPLVVLGWSTSGLVAYELARLLSTGSHRAEPIDVRTLVLVDTYYPGEEKKLWSNRMSKYAPLVKRAQIGELAREVRATARRRARRSVGGLGRRLVAWSDPNAAPSVPATTVSTANPDEAFDYEPPEIDVPTVLYAATTTNPARTIEPWAAIVPDLTVVAVEGRHRGFDSVMGTERVGQIANDLVVRLDPGHSH